AVRDVMAGHGGMGSLALTPDEAAERLAPFGERLSLAAVNGPSSVVVSGQVAALEELLAACEAEGTWVRRIPVDYASHSAAVEGLRERLAEDLAPIEPRSGTVPFFSTVEAEVLDTATLGAGYWYRNLRNPVRFSDAVGALIAGGASAFVEVSPNPGLTVAIQSAAEAAGAPVAAIGTLRRDQGGIERFLTALGEAHVHGTDVGWGALFEATGAQRVELPTYAFQRERFWLESRTGAGDLSAAGIGSVDHPLLGAAVQMADADEWLFSGRVDGATHGWIHDHVVLDTVVLPGTAFVDIALAAGDVAECDVVEELTFESPLVLGEHDAVELQVRMEAPDPSGRRAVAIYSRTEEPPLGGGDRVWTRHAIGAVAPAAGDARSELVDRLAAESWPPDGAEEIDVDGLYDRLSGLGFSYGPAFTGIRAAWRRADEVFAEVALDPEHSEGAERYRVHPALFDSAMHGVVELLPDGADGQGTMLFHWEGARRHGGHGTSLRVRIGVAGDRWNLAALDELGTPVVSVEAVVARPVDAEQLALARRGDDARLRLEWAEAPVPSTNGHTPRFAVLGDLDAGAPGERHPDLRALVDAIEEGDQPPDVVMAAMPRVEAGDAAEAARAGIHRTLELLQAWLAEERLSAARLVLVTRGAVAALEGEVPDPGAAAAWGLVRSSQAEHPGRFGLIDTDGAEASWQAASVQLAAG
ncbi:MAG: polyketide synthase dehydratase domain-containing protein, partial [Actinomycetota bacterium]|nr:polyketide synthase dehydratase domain-containing protein [Actinomycetota bacterium]